MSARPSPFTTEAKIISLPEAAKLFENRRGGATHRSTVWRYATYGFRGVVLETRSVKGVLMTSEPAVSRFLAAVAKLDGQHSANWEARRKVAARRGRGRKSRGKATAGSGDDGYLTSQGL
jgi:hypothetical protein